MENTLWLILYSIASSCMSFTWTENAQDWTPAETHCVSQSIHLHVYILFFPYNIMHLVKKRQTQWFEESSCQEWTMFILYDFMCLLFG